MKRSRIHAVGEPVISGQMERQMENGSDRKVLLQPTT